MAGKRSPGSLLSPPRNSVPVLAARWLNQAARRLFWRYIRPLRRKALMEALVAMARLPRMLSQVEKDRYAQVLWKLGMGPIRRLTDEELDAEVLAALRAAESCASADDQP